MIDSKRLKKQILEVAFKANKGHIGSALSISDLLSSVFNYFINTDSLDEQKNCVTLSKGHAALALYSCLNQLKLISNQDLFGYESDGSLLGTHPDPELPWVNFIGGSLGQGIAFASGFALADHYSGKHRNHYVILSDSELNAGVVWEIATIVGTKKLNNLTVLLDNNQQQALDLTKNILVYEDVATSFRVLGWDVTEVDGHNEMKILETLGKSHNKPHLIICKTSFGAGISFMEGNISWHYLPLSNELYEKAMNEIEVSS
jgi:transketolase